MLVALGGLSLLIWLYLFVLHHRFWRADQYLPAPEALESWPTVTAIIPARNEAASIAACVKSLLVQDYSGAFQVIVVDDHSTDETNLLAKQAGAGFNTPLTVLTAPSLEKGWSGKLWALQAGLDHAPDDTAFVWLTDADITHAPETLRTLVSKAETDNRDLVSLMVKLHCVSFWERLIVPAFVYFFQMLYPFPAVNDPTHKTAGAAGGCILIRHSALARIGGLAAIKNNLIDDCALAAAVQKAGGRLWLGLTQTSQSLRAADGLSDLWRMVTRTAFTQLRFSLILLSGTLAGLAIMFIIPPALTIMGAVNHTPFVALLGVAAWGLMAITYGPTLRLYGQNPLKALLLPFSGMLYGLMTLHSALNHWSGRSSHWKDRTYQRS